MVRGLKLFSVLAVSILFLTGCGNSNKTLTCTNSEESSGIKMDQEVTMTFDNDKVNYVKMTINSKATSSAIENNWDMFASMMEEQFQDKKETGVSLSTSNDSSKHEFKVELEVDLTKAKASDLEEYGLDSITDANATYEETKKDAEDSGFTCK